MSDYLGALISRTFDEPDVVRPRSVSHFERRAPDLERVPREDVVPSLAAPEAGNPGKEAGAPRLPAWMDALRKPLMVEQGRNVTAVAAPREVSPSSPHDDTLRVLPPTTNPPATRVTIVRPPPGSLPESNSGVKPARQERIGAAPVAATPIPQPVSMERRAEAPPQPKLATPPRAVLPAAGQPHTIPDSPAIESAAGIERRVAAQASPRSAPPSEPPAIHVTIGRIEIRATSAAATPVRRQHRQPPVMSLDEYLEQCAGGGQR